MDVMLRFRPPDPAFPPGDVADLLAVSRVVDDAMRPGNFFVDPDLRLTWIAARAETIPWEIFRGRLLDRTQTRLQKPFLSWHVVQDGATEPTISVKLDVHERRIHVVRGLLVYAWEGYDAGGGVIKSREVQKWTRELVGSISLDEIGDLEALHDELICLIWQAVVGTSRLPLTSVEAPLPAFVIGQLHYVFRDEAGPQPVSSWQDLTCAGSLPKLAPTEKVKLLEFVLRGKLIDAIHFLAASGELLSMPQFRAMFNNVSLSPYTRFASNALTVAITGAPPADAIDFYTHLLCQLSRHLTAYDLITFHHRGANYPDALLLDDILKRIVGVASWPQFFRGNDTQARNRRRALRHACLLRRHYEGHPVPDAPTSPGENARVMPARHVRVPEDQLTQTNKRQKRLFANEPFADWFTPAARNVLAAGASDLEHLSERVEMGLGLFIDRPLGYGKQIGEPDLTPMLAHEAFSPSLARRRWRELKDLCAELAIPVDAAKLDPLFENGPWPEGLPHSELADCPRPVAALTDVRKVAADFVILRTMPRGLKDLLARGAWRPLLARFRLGFLAEGQVRLCVVALDDAKQPVIALYDSQLRRRLELTVDADGGFFTRAGTEWPRTGLRVQSVWEDTNDENLVLRRGVDIRA